MSFWGLLGLYLFAGMVVSYACGRVWEAEFTDSPGPIFTLAAWPIMLPFLVASVGRQRTQREFRRALYTPGQWKMPGGYWKRRSFHRRSHDLSALW